MDLIVALISIDIIAAKFLNSYIASERLKFSDEKRFSIFGRFFEKLGFENDNWLSFYCTIMLVVISAYFVTNIFPGTAFKMLFIFTGLFTIILNLSAAHSSYFGRKNFITEKLLQD